MTGDLPLLGFGLPVSGRWATPDTIRRIARRAEELGYASLWTFQRVLSPAAAALGPSHRSVLDPVVPLAHVAGHTDRIRLGTATICAPFTAPALLAKTLTSLDVLSGGRLTVGSRDGLAAGGVRRRRRAVRAARRADGRVPALPGGAVDAGPRRVRGRVLHRAALARGPAARAATAPAGAAGRRRRAGAAPRRAARPGLDLQQPAGPHRPRRVDRDGARRRARGRARPGRPADRGRGSSTCRRDHGDADRSRDAEQVLDDLAACARRASRRSSSTSTSHAPASDVEYAERVLDAFAPTRLRPSA